ncbi:MAG: NAD(P)-dependent oxidoreductase, partial [Paraprevotella sp.]|nr:NAD(P)-dependent oxidoreductase [Paraprevotella sp.]
TNKVPFTEETFAQLPRLRFIGVTATGYNIIDIEAARRHQVIVSNIPAYSTASVAQSVFAMLLTITNRVEHYTHQIIQEGSWTHSADFCYWDTPLTELEGKRMGIVGVGGIGSRVASMAQAFGMDVVALSRRPQKDLPLGVTKLEGDAFWSSCHIISLHCPLTPATHHLISDSTLSLMRPGTILINTSRGAVVDEQAVADALRSGLLSAYAADVLSTEPPQPHNPLLAAPNVFLTPHIAWATREARMRLLHILEDNVRAFIQGAPIHTV